jgi:diadenosine tetraphosphatase ApaH/serine/threonine PP2A family protein phosphatase
LEARDHFAAQTQRLCFIGHTHLPAVWHVGDAGNIKVSRGEGRMELTVGGKMLVNVGSVGQPRDHHPAACYVIYDRQADTVEFRRVKYDIGKASRKILRAKLPHSAAQRLIVGK